MLIGYARVSTDDQNLDLQKDALHKVKCQRIFEEKRSGGTIQREELNRALDILRPGDTLVVWRLDRLGRSLRHLIEIVNALEEKGIGFKSLTENIDTTTSTGKLVFHIFGALSEFERNLIKERTRAGLDAARIRGRKGGRPKALSPDKVKMAISLYTERHPITSICKTLNITKPTLYKYLDIENGKDVSRQTALKKGQMPKVVT